MSAKSTTKDDIQRRSRQVRNRIKNSNSLDRDEAPRAVHQSNRSRFQTPNPQKHVFHPYKDSFSDQVVHQENESEYENKSGTIKIKLKGSSNSITDHQTYESTPNSNFQTPKSVSSKYSKPNTNFNNL